MSWDLPPRTALPGSAPRYPNLWFFVDRRLLQEAALAAQRAGRYPAPSRRRSFELGLAVRLVALNLEEHCHLRDDYGYVHAGEGCDGRARASGLQWTGGFADPSLGHAHQLHIRYYYSTLGEHAWKPCRADGTAAEGYYSLAASVHYEVEQEHPRHPYIEECPVCGRTGEYARPGDMCEVVHDPLGLELVLHGTIRGRIVRDPLGRRLNGITGMRRDYAVTVEVLTPYRTDMNTARIACVTLEPQEDPRPGAFTHPRPETSPVASGEAC